MTKSLAVCGLLLLAVALVFGQTVRFGFVNLDNTAVVSGNRHLTAGPTAEAVTWAFTHRYLGLYAPVTWLSHMLDCQVYGLRAGGHHLTNVLLHAAAAVLLFLVLRQMTGCVWPSALVAAVFAVHPLRAESVAWVTERKDVLSGLFFVLTLWAYVRYVRHRFSLLRYLAVIVLFGLGLLAKPMLVTLPFVLLLLDYWPLMRVRRRESRGREEGERGREGERETSGRRPAAESPLLPLSPSPPLVRRLIWEKVPMLALAIALGIIAVCSFTAVGGDALTQGSSVSWRVENAPISYCRYLGMFFYPADLAVQYPTAGPDVPPWKVSGAVVVLALVTWAALNQRRRRPYLLVGWLWYLGMLAPVCGLCYFGLQAVSDRFTYLPQIGLSIALVWGAADALAWLPFRRTACGVAAALALAALMGLAWQQTSFWHDSRSLWTRSLACTSPNAEAHRGLGEAFLDRGQIDQAIEQCRAAIAIDPANATAHFNLGVALAAAGRLDEAIGQYRQALECLPNYAAAHNNLGQALLLRGWIEEGMAHCQEALRIDPELAEAHYNVGNVFYSRGRVDAAITEYRKALALRPDFIEARRKLDQALAGR